MAADTAQAPYGVLSDSATLTLQRVLPGPIDRVWAYLTQSDLRRQWLASGEMGTAPGAEFELTWRNDELTDPPGERPAGFDAEHRMASRMIEIDPPRRLSFSWGTCTEVSFDLQAQGSHVLLTVVHRRLPDKATVLMVGPGWHAHLDILAARLQGVAPAPFWPAWLALKEDYTRRFAASAPGA